MTLIERLIKIIHIAGPRAVWALIVRRKIIKTYFPTKPKTHQTQVEITKPVIDFEYTKVKDRISKWLDRRYTDSP